ncbi:hypothetical protein [Roseibium algae]|uniref:Uncharacterized protein n=1 Tax=Roseibium algae TaxID=3123038 RepID=A0ABU8TP90_9HYPH
MKFGSLIKPVLLTGSLLCALATLAGCAGQANGNASAWYNGREAIGPTASRIYICHGFGCTYTTPVDFSGRDLRRLKTILASGRKSPAAERRAISKAVQWQETRVGPTVGSSNDVGGLDMQNARVRGQMDCIDEATNTNSLLLVAEKHGFLKHHSVSSPVARGFFLDGRYPHATATVREINTNAVFAVDSWPDSNGKPPKISELTVWMSKRAG